MALLGEHGINVNKTTLDKDLKRMEDYKGSMAKTSSIRAVDELISEMTEIKNEAKTTVERKDAIMKLAVLHEKRQRLFDLLDARKARKKISKKKLPTKISFGEVEVAESVTMAKQED